MMSILIVLGATATYIVTTIIQIPEKARWRAEREPAEEEHPSYERRLFSELVKAWVSGNERWLLPEYIVKTDRFSW